MNVRAFAASDLDAFYDICLRTGAKGSDASATCIHPRLFGDYFAAPYASFDPASCLVLEDAEGVSGYVVGALDTAAYLAWFNTTWLPRCRERHAETELVPGAPDAIVLEWMRSEARAPAIAREYPAHLHLNLLPRAQGRGFGQRLFEAWLAHARQASASGLHLGVARENTRAQAFYEKCGMRRTEPGSIFFVLELG